MKNYFKLLIIPRPYNWTLDQIKAALERLQAAKLFQNCPGLFEEIKTALCTSEGQLEAYKTQLLAWQNFLEESNVTAESSAQALFDLSPSKTAPALSVEKFSDFVFHNPQITEFFFEGAEALNKDEFSRFYQAFCEDRLMPYEMPSEKLLLLFELAKAKTGSDVLASFDEIEFIFNSSQEKRSNHALFYYAILIIANRVQAGLSIPAKKTMPVDKIIPELRLSLRLLSKNYSKSSSRYSLNHLTYFESDVEQEIENLEEEINATSSPPTKSDRILTLYSATAWTLIKHKMFTDEQRCLFVVKVLLKQEVDIHHIQNKQLFNDLVMEECGKDLSRCGEQRIRGIGARKLALLAVAFLAFGVDPKPFFEASNYLCELSDKKNPKRFVVLDILLNHAAPNYYESNRETLIKYFSGSASSLDYAITHLLFQPELSKTGQDCIRRVTTLQIRSLQAAKKGGKDRVRNFYLERCFAVAKHRQGTDLLKELVSEEYRKDNFIEGLHDEQIYPLYWLKTKDEEKIDRFFGAIEIKKAMDEDVPCLQWLAFFNLEKYNACIKSFAERSAALIAKNPKTIEDINTYKMISGLKNFLSLFLFYHSEEWKNYIKKDPIGNAGFIKVLSCYLVEHAHTSFFPKIFHFPVYPKEQVEQMLELLWENTNFPRQSILVIMVGLYSLLSEWFPEKRNEYYAMCAALKFHLSLYRGFSEETHVFNIQPVNPYFSYRCNGPGMKFLTRIRKPDDQFKTVLSMVAPLPEITKKFMKVLNHYNRNANMYSCLIKNIVTILGGIQATTDNEKEAVAWVLLYGVCKSLRRRLKTEEKMASVEEMAITEEFLGSLEDLTKEFANPDAFTRHFHYAITQAHEWCICLEYYEISRYSDIRREENAPLVKIVVYDERDIRNQYVAYYDPSHLDQSSRTQKPEEKSQSRQKESTALAQTSIVQKGEKPELQHKESIEVASGDSLDPLDPFSSEREEIEGVVDLSAITRSSDESIFALTTNSSHRLKPPGFNLNDEAFIADDEATSLQPPNDQNHSLGFFSAYPPVAGHADKPEALGSEPDDEKPIAGDEVTPPPLPNGQNYPEFFSMHQSGASAAAIPLPPTEASTQRPTLAEHTVTKHLDEVRRMFSPS